MKQPDRKDRSVAQKQFRPVLNDICSGKQESLDIV